MLAKYVHHQVCRLPFLRANTDILPSQIIYQTINHTPGILKRNGDYCVSSYPKIVTRFMSVLMILIQNDTLLITQCDYYFERFSRVILNIIILFYRPLAQINDELLKTIEKAMVQPGWLVTRL